MHNLLVRAKKHFKGAGLKLDAPKDILEESIFKTISALFEVLMILTKRFQKTI